MELLVFIRFAKIVDSFEETPTSTTSQPGKLRAIPVGDRWVPSIFQVPGGYQEVGPAKRRSPIVDQHFSRALPAHDKQAMYTLWMHFHEDKVVPFSFCGTSLEEKRA